MVWVAFRNYRLDHSIFVDESVLEPVKRIDELVENALHEWRIEKEHPDPRPDRFSNQDELFKVVPPLRETLDAMVRERINLVLRPTPQRDICTGHF